MDIVCLIMGVVFYHCVGLQVFLESFFVTRVDPCLKRKNSAVVTPFLLKLMHCSMFSCSVTACTASCMQNLSIVFFSYIQGWLFLKYTFYWVWSCLLLYSNWYISWTLFKSYSVHNIHHTYFRQWPNACFKITGRCW